MRVAHVAVAKNTKNAVVNDNGTPVSNLKFTTPEHWVADFQPSDNTNPSPEEEQKKCRN